MQNNRNQLFLFLCLSFLGFLFFASALVFLPLPESISQVWKGYHTVLIDESADLSQVETGFLDAGFKEVVHYNNVIVEFFNFSGLASIRLADVPHRFENEDPRLDSYLLNLPRYFFTKQGGKIYSILYVKEKENRLYSIAQCRQVLRKLSYDWHLVDVKPLFLLLILSLFGAVLFFTLMSDRSQWLFLLAAALPWTVFIVLGGFFEFIGASFIIITFSFFFRNYRPVFRFFLNHGYIDGGSRKAGFSLILFAAAVLAAFGLLLGSGPGTGMVLRFVSALVSMGFLFFF